jgi:Uma2 family endonuclease
VSSKLKHCFFDSGNKKEYFKESSERAMETTTQTFTYADYQKLPESEPCQLIGGELIMSPAPTLYHQQIIGNIFSALREYVIQKKLGKIFFSPVDVYLDNENIFQPDIVFISTERSSILDEQKINGAPDVVIEILSPSTAYYDLKKKKEIYEKYGVKEYWIVDPMEKTIDLLVHENGIFVTKGRAAINQTISSMVIPGCVIQTNDIF